MRQHDPRPHPNHRRRARTPTAPPRPGPAGNRLERGSADPAGRPAPEGPDDRSAERPNRGDGARAGVGAPTEPEHARIGHGSLWTSVRLDIVSNSTIERGRCQPSGRRKMRGRDLTDRQQEVLDHIREHVRRHGTAPSRAELAKSLGLAFASAVNHHLRALEKKGWLQLNPGSYRNIQLLREGTPVFDPSRLPEVAAGTPILADDSQAIMRVPDELARQIHPQADFYLVVRGDSMSCVGYQTGDIIAVRRTPDASNGEVVVARIGTDITLKCFHRPTEERIELRPRSKNPEHCTIVIDEQTEDWEIVGVVVGAMIGTPRLDSPAR